MESDREYFRRRSIEEREAALRTRDSKVRMVHLEMAARYDDLLRQPRLRVGGRNLSGRTAFASPVASVRES